MPLLDLHSTPTPPSSAFKSFNSSKSAPSSSAAHSSIAYSVQALAVRCMSAALEPARVESGRAAQIATAQKLRDPLFTALASCAISLSPEAESVMPALIDALARALANQLQYGQPKPSPAAIVTELERRFLSVPSTRARSLPAAILCAVARETRDKMYESYSMCGTDF